MSGTISTEEKSGEEKGLLKDGTTPGTWAILPYFWGGSNLDWPGMRILWLTHRKQYRPGSPVHPIFLSGRDWAALIFPASGKVLFLIVYPQSVTLQPLLADLNGDIPDDFLVVGDDAIWR